MTRTSERITTRDGVRLALKRVGEADGAPVVLAHGTFSNHRSCAALAAFLARRGLACWLFDWRGHGDSERPRGPYTFDTVAAEDVPAILDAVRAQSGGQRAYWVGHSGGGLIASMWMARNPSGAARQIAGLVLLASQASASAANWRQRVLMRATALWLRSGVRLSGRLLRVGPEPEEAAVMRQWCRWNLRSTFTGEDGFDYQAALRAIDVPVLALAGAGDKLIAPAAGCEALAAAFGTADRRFHLCSRAHGYLEDYRHDRLVLSRSAEREIWPLVERWLYAHGAVAAQHAA